MLPLLNLPRLPRDQIIKAMDFVEIFHFSMLSKRCAAAVESAKIKVNRIKWASPSSSYWINVDSFTISLEVNETSYEETSRSQHFKLKSFWSDEIVDYTSKPIKCFLEHLSAHILKIFKTDRLILVENTTRPSIPIFWYRLNLRFASVCLSCSDYDEWKDGLISHESLNFLLDNIKTDAFYFHPKSAPGFQYTKPLKFKTLHINNAEWFTLDNLLNMESEILRVKDSKITTSDLNIFFDKWKQGCYPKLKYLILDDPTDILWELNITTEETDGEGRQVLTDVNGNRGTFETNTRRLIEFEVNLRND